MGYLRLLNLPLIFTALGDVVAGCVIVTATRGEAPGLMTVLMLLVASACLFGAGSVSRACFEFEDEKKTSSRSPLDEGEVTLKGAFFLATGLAVAGMLAAMIAAMLSAKAGVYFAWALLFVHWLHGGYLRDFDVTGPLAVGATRLLNILLGMSAHEELLYSFDLPEHILPAAILTVFVVLVAIVGRLRAEGGTRFTLMAAGGGLAVTLLAAVIFYWTRSAFAVILITMVAAAMAVPLLYAIALLSPRSIGRVVMAGTFAALLLNASFIFGASVTLTGGWVITALAAIFTVGLAVPAAAAWRLAPSAGTDGIV